MKVSMNQIQLADRNLSEVMWNNTEKYFCNILCLNEEKGMEIIMKKQEDKIPSVVIDKIIFNDDSEFEFNRDDIVLLVGSNNVGKSKTLKELKMDLQENYDNRIGVRI